jgi:hypothetical protein
MASDSNFNLFGFSMTTLFDINADGLWDVLTSTVNRNYNSGNAVPITVQTATGTGDTMNTSSIYNSAFTSGSWIYAETGALEDYNDDGKIDTIVSSDAPKKFGIMLGN